MARARRSRKIAATPQQLWDVLEDPHHLPRWWPTVTRVEAVTEDRWTVVHVSRRGRPVLADFHLLASEPLFRRLWEQDVEGSPFERVLQESVTEIVLNADPAGTLVTIEQRQKLKGYSRTGGFLLNRATRDRLDEALDGLERICG